MNFGRIVPHAASIDGVGCSIWHHTFEKVAMTSFHAKRVLPVTRSVCWHLSSSVCQFLIYSTFVLTQWKNGNFYSQLQNFLTDHFQTQIQEMPGRPPHSKTWLRLNEGFCLNSVGGYELPYCNKDLLFTCWGIFCLLCDVQLLYLKIYIFMIEYYIILHF